MGNMKEKRKEKVTVKIYSAKKSIKYNTPTRLITDFKTPISIVYTNNKELKSAWISPSSKSKFLKFNWGYDGILPYNLSISILSDFFDLDDFSILLVSNEYKKILNMFYFDYIVENKSPSWEITEDEITIYINDCMRQLGI